MEYVAGMNLRDLLRQKGKIPLHDAVEIVVQALEGLSAAHGRGVIHHDIKPENILITEEGVVKLADFGLGKVLESTASMILQSGSVVTGTGSPVTGTLRYMAPEQREGRTGDARSDLYSLGVVLFEMLTGEFPQGAERPTDVDPGLPSWVDDVFQRCYTRLEKRYPSADHMIRDLGRRSDWTAEDNGVRFLGDVKVKPKVRSVEVRPDGKRSAGHSEKVIEIRRPKSVLLWPLYFLTLLFQVLARGSYEVTQFLSGDNPSRSRVAPYFLLFLALFGIALLGSVLLRRGWRDARSETTTVQSRARVQSPRQIRSQDTDTDSLVGLLANRDHLYLPARDELLRRGGIALPVLLSRYSEVRGMDHEMETELGAVIGEIHAGLHPEGPTILDEKGKRAVPYLERAGIRTLVESLGSLYWGIPARYELVRRGPDVLDDLTVRYAKLREEGSSLADPLGTVISEILAKRYASAQAWR
jgi:serine/threonine protein kinase